MDEKFLIDAMANINEQIKNVLTKMLAPTAPVAALRVVRSPANLAAAERSATSRRATARASR